MRNEAAVVGEKDAAPKEASHCNGVRQSRARRFLLGILTDSAGALIVWTAVWAAVWVAVLVGRPLHLSAQTLHYAKTPNTTNGEKVYKGGCIACHGSDGKGAPKASTVFRRPAPF